MVALLLVTVAVAVKRVTLNDPEENGTALSLYIVRSFFVGRRFASDLKSLLPRKPDRHRFVRLSIGHNNNNNNTVRTQHGVFICCCCPFKSIRALSLSHLAQLVCLDSIASINWRFFFKFIRFYFYFFFGRVSHR